MDSFHKRDLVPLTNIRNGPCVTVYLPTHLAGKERQQDPVRLKNLLRQAQIQLSESWLSPIQASELLRPACQLITDSSFWENRSQGLALFVNADSFHRYRLPVRFDEGLFVNRRFHVKPLLPLLEGEDRFFVLALSQNEVRMFRCCRYTIEQVDVPCLPTNMNDALNYSDVDRGSQVHSAKHSELVLKAA